MATFFFNYWFYYTIHWLVDLQDFDTFSEINKRKLLLNFLAYFFNSAILINIIDYEFITTWNYSLSWYDRVGDKFIQFIIWSVALLPAKCVALYSL